MAKPAGKIVSLTELRFKPANSNDAARDEVAHHFAEVPRCSFAKDDAISQYLGSETGMETAPAAPDTQPPRNVDVPVIQQEAPDTSGSLRRRLLRSGFALSVLLHAAVAAAVGYVTLSMPDQPDQEEGLMSISLVINGTADVDATAAGGAEEVEKPEEEKPVEVKPVEKPVPKIEKPATEVPKPQPVETQTVLKDIPLPVMGEDLPDILTAKEESKTEIEQVAKPAPIEKKVELQEDKKPAMPVMDIKPVEKKIEEKPKPVEVQKPEPQKEEPKREELKKEEPKKEEPKPEPEKKDPPKKKEKPKEKRPQKRGAKGAAANSARKGDVNSRNQQSSTGSQGRSDSREVGNAARSNYKGLVNRKLSRAKGRIASPAKGSASVAFNILADGSISGLRIARSSGKPAVDKTALDVVRKALPFPPLPAGLGASWPAKLEISFR